MIRALIDLIGTVAILAVCGPTPLGFAVVVAWTLLVWGTKSR